jgi:23S rRNA (uracil1939-C5)-methyltransferase
MVSEPGGRCRPRTRPRQRADQHRRRIETSTVDRGRLGVERLVYVSCEPTTHTHDIALLVRGGYRVGRAAVVDMFPQTYHVESVARLTPA